MLALGYAALGLLVGILAGLSSSEIAAALMAAVFTFAGGAATLLLKEEHITQKRLGTILLSFAPLCLAGLFTGIVIKENRLLTNVGRVERLAALKLVEPGEPYLKGVSMNKLHAINTRFRNGDLTAQAAYEELWKIVTE